MLWWHLTIEAFVCQIILQESKYVFASTSYSSTLTKHSLLIFNHKENKGLPVLYVIVPYDGNPASWDSAYVMIWGLNVKEANFEQENVIKNIYHGLA